MDIYRIAPDETDDFCDGEKLSIPQQFEADCKKVAEIEDGLREDDPLRRYFDELFKLEPLKDEEFSELLLKIKSGDMDARMRLTETHLPFVVITAERFRKREIPFVDILQEGNLALVNVIDNFGQGTYREFRLYAGKFIESELRSRFKNGNIDIRKSEADTIGSVKSETEIKTLRDYLYT